MKIFVLSSYLSPDLASKVQAAKLREEVEKHGNPIVLDFAGVRVMSFTFAEELFGRLVRDYGVSCLRTRFRVRNMSPRVRGILNGVLEHSDKKAA